MTRIRCPQNRCLNWDAGLCTAAEIELDIETLTCMTFDDAGPPLAALDDDLEDDFDELEWDDDESIFEDDLDESLYGADDDDEDEEDLELELLDDDDDDASGWGF